MRAEATNQTAETARIARAVLYLRVSTNEQADKADDHEGYSIPAQREAGHRMAEQHGAQVVDEYLDRGESAKSADRPALQEMLARLERDKDVDFVIVHKVDRLARSRADDVAITMAIRSSNAQLVSCSENVDETPSGRLLHGIMATIAEYYSGNLATEALKGMTAKAKKGGTPFMAPIGYRNVAANKDDGTVYRTIEVDKERAIHVRWAFEQYATGEWSDRDIQEALADRGLRTRSTRSRPSCELSRSRVAGMLGNPYYVGIVRFRGASYPGTHEPLIAADLFDRVQEIRRAHDVAGTRRRIHEHYLKGSIFCGTCGARLCLRKTIGQAGGVYFYFFCRARADRSGCPQPYVLVDKVEAAVEDYYRRVQLPAWLVEEIQVALGSEIAKTRDGAQATIDLQQRRIDKLKREQAKLIQAHLADAIPLDMLKTEQERVAREMERAGQLLTGASARFEDMETVLQGAVELAGSCSDAYLLADDATRRQFNQAFFEKVYVHQDKVTRADFKGVMKELVDDQTRLSIPQRGSRQDTLEGGSGGENEDNPRRRYLRGHLEGEGCHSALLAHPAGFEPTTFSTAN